MLRMTKLDSCHLFIYSTATACFSFVGLIVLVLLNRQWLEFMSLHQIGIVTHPKKLVKYSSVVFAQYISNAQHFSKLLNTQLLECNTAAGFRFLVIGLGNGEWTLEKQIMSESGLRCFCGQFSFAAVKTCHRPGIHIQRQIDFGLSITSKQTLVFD